MQVACRCGRLYRRISVWPVLCSCGERVAPAEWDADANPHWSDIRLAICRKCDAFAGGVCKKQKAITPEKMANVFIGIGMANAKCPDDKWGKEVE